MKKLYLFALLLLLTVFSSYAQIQNTIWKGTLKIDNSPEALFDFGKDTLKVRAYQNNMVIETMTYAYTDTSFTVKKVEGQSDCDNTVLGKYKFTIKGDELTLKAVKDDCDDRSSALNDTKWTRFAWPAEVKVDEAVLKQYPGTYAMDDQHSITISLENGRLMAESPTNLPGKTLLYGQSDTRFLFHIRDVALEFVKDNNGAVTKFVVYEDGKTYDWKKVK